MSRDCVTGSNHIRELREVPQPASAEYLSTMREAETNSRLSSSMSSSMPWLIPTMTIAIIPPQVQWEPWLSWKPSGVSVRDGRWLQRSGAGRTKTESSDDDEYDDKHQDDLMTITIFPDRRGLAKRARAWLPSWNISIEPRQDLALYRFSLLRCTIIITTWWQIRPCYCWRGKDCCGRWQRAELNQVQRCPHQWQGLSSPCQGFKLLCIVAGRLSPAIAENQARDQWRGLQALKMFASKMEALSRPLSDHIWGCRRSKATLFGCVIVNVKNKSDDYRCEDVGVWRWECFLHSCELGSRPFDFLNQKQKHNAPNLQHQKHPSLSEEDKASKFIFGGEKFRFEAGRLVRCSLASFVALHKRRRGEERFIVMIFCCTALDTVVGINLGAVMNIMWRWTKCNSSTQESDASEY